VHLTASRASAPGRRPLALPGVLALALAAALLLGAPLTASPAVAQTPPPPSGADHEIWALDQGADVNRIHIYDSSHEEVDVIDFEQSPGRTEPDADNPRGRSIVDTPHMIDFTSDFAYAFVASTRSGNVTVIRTDDREILDVIPTGATAHFAGVTPDDSAVWVANIGAKTFTEISIDREAERFELTGRELDVTTDPLYPAAYANLERSLQPGPVCHQYTADSRYAYVTLGPTAVGGLVVIDLQHDSGQPVIDTAFDPEVVRANCGVGLSADGETMYANFGSPAPAEDGGDQGEWYAFDTSDHSLITTQSSRGADAHGLRVTPDGSELWMLNRQSSDAIVVDTATNDVIAELDDIGESPDILDFSPDGSLAYLSLRGPNPRSGGTAVHPIAGDTPGFAVVDTATRELVEIIQPAEGRADFASSDVHGLAVRHLPEVADAVQRVSGPNRVATAVAVSRASFDDGDAGGAVLARAGDYPDALTGTPLARSVDGPVLLTPTDDLPDSVGDELARALPEGATVHVLGGASAVGPAVTAAVEARGLRVERIAGPTRFETAIEVARELGDPDIQLITTGLDFADALSAGAAAASIGGAVLLTTPDVAQEATAAYLAEHDAAARYAVGGPAVAAHPDATPLTGETRFETAVAVAVAFFDGADLIGLATGEDFPDALAGGAHIASLGGPLLLTPGSSLHPSVVAYACERAEGLEGAFAYGGTGVLADTVLSTLASRIDGSGCGDAETVAATAAAFAAADGASAICHLPVA
jgi:YVTN family beta-propeller protein